MKEQCEKNTQKVESKAQEKEKNSMGVSQPFAVSEHGSLHALPQFGGGLREKD